MIIDKNSLDIPQNLLDLKFFDEIIENALKESNIQIKNVSYSMGSSAGENYCSQIYRALIKYLRKNQLNDENIFIIIKSIPIVEQTEFLNDLNVFLKEKIIYFDVLPRLEILLDNVKFGPKCYYTLKEPIQTIVFEDLNHLGYVMGNREHGLDYQHSSMVLKKLGKFHASSMVLAKKDPEIMKHFNYGLMHKETMEKSKSFQIIIGSNLAALIGAIDNMPGYEKMTKKLKIIEENYIEKIGNHVLPRNGELLVLNHGDLWVNNFMFKYDQYKQVEDTVFLDYQMSFYSSPGIDLNYFFNTSLNHEVLTTRRDDLVKIYHNSLHNTLIELHWKGSIPTLKDIQYEVRMKEFYGFIAFFAIFPIIALNKSDSGDMSIETMIDKDIGKVKRELIYKSKRFMDALKFSLKRFDDLRVFD